MLSGSEASAATVLIACHPWMLRCAQHDTRRGVCNGKR